MEIMEIIKEAMIFPSTDLAKLAIYIVLAIVAGLLVTFGFILFGVGLANNSLVFILGLILFVVGLIVGFIIMGYQISIIKSGIERDEKVPEFNWKGNLITGIKYLVVNIVYFIIPAIVILIVAWATNLFGIAYTVVNKMMMASMSAPANATVAVADAVPQTILLTFGSALMITGIVAFIFLLIFAFIQTMGKSRLAKTDSIGEAVNIPEAFRDIGRIGYGKVIVVVILIFVIIAVINAIINGLNGYINGIGILSIIVTPYMVFFAARATGLLYSDIA
ncbi:DUF4013 domain-containing protein [Methanobrevibacter sp.]|uniref:DUF4013 domain-containing protein n=1 Tax=Methanobrevibacter sp. TaxID=66852 RepID=UPI0038662BC0